MLVKKGLMGEVTTDHIGENREEGHLREGFFERDLQGIGEKSVADGWRLWWVDRYV